MLQHLASDTLFSALLIRTDFTVPPATSPTLSQYGRRRCRWLLGLLLLLVLLTAHGEDTDAAPRVVAIDWGQAQTLTAMGVTPVAVGQVTSYNTWVGAPKLPPSVQDIGLRAQPNLELLAQIAPDVITITPMYVGLKPLLARIAPVKIIGIYGDGRPVWRATIEATRALGRAVDRPVAAEQLIDRTKTQIATLAQRLPDDVPPVLVIQFQDARHVRVYAKGSLIDATLTRLGLDNAWHGPSTVWGAALVPLARLARLDNARLIIVKPLPVGVEQALRDNMIWQRLPIVRKQPVVRIPGVWSYGGLPSATRFAQLLVAALGYAEPPASTKTQTP